MRPKQLKLKMNSQLFNIFTLNGGKIFLLLLKRLALRSGKKTRKIIHRYLNKISVYPEATSLLELAIWKAKIEEVGAATVDESEACRGEVHGPVRETIVQCLRG